MTALINRILHRFGWHMEMVTVEEMRADEARVAKVLALARMSARGPVTLSADPADAGAEFRRRTAAFMASYRLV